MKENKEKFKQFVIEQLKDYDEWREASPDGYAEIIADEAVKLFCQPDVSGSYMVERIKKILEQPEPLKEPPYNCPSTGDKRVGNGCLYPNCMCEWYL